MGIFSFLRESKQDTAQTAPQRETASCTDPVYLTRTVVFGYGDSSVYFVDENRGIRKMLVDPTGGIRHFPGIIQEDFWVKKVSGNVLLPRIHYRTSFSKRDDRWIMLWTVQPDGDYWRDEDGFGGENEDEVVLYTFVDGNGDYTGTFRIYEVGNLCYCLDKFELAHANRYSDALQALKTGKLEEQAVEILFPRLHGMELYRGFRMVGEYYTLSNQKLAAEYWAHPVLSRHLLEAAEALLQLDMPIAQIAGHPYHKIVHGCMTLFYAVSKEPVFQQVLDTFFEGKPDDFTSKRLSV